MELLPQLLLNALITGSIYALASAGLALIYGLLKVLNFAHGHMMMLGAYLFYLFALVLGLGIFPAAMLTLVATGIFAILALNLFVLPFSRSNLLLTLVSTLALSTILESTVAMTFGVNVKSLSVDFDLQSYEFAGVYVTPIQIIIIATALSLLGLLALIVHKAPFGRKIRALREHMSAGQSLGISRRQVSQLVFVVGTIIAAIAGILVGYETNIQPTMGNAYTIKAFAAMILGGLGSIWGTVVGSYVLGLIENLSIGLDLGAWSVPAGYKDAFAFVIILLVLLFKPEGIFGSKMRKT